MTYTLSQYATAVAKIEGLSQEEAEVRERNTRNLSQRHPIAPVGKSGRKDLYDLRALAALRIVQTASDVGLGRAELNALTLKLLSDHPTVPRHKVEGGYSRKCVAAEYVSRVRSGVASSLKIQRTRNGWTIYDFGFSDSKIVDEIFASAGAEPIVVATLELHVSNLLSDLLEALEA